jgi:hypothetical protein
MNMANRHRPESSITSSIVSVGRGGGRGFVIEIPGQRQGRVPVTLRERMIVTAAHCLPSLPTPHPWALDSRSWKLLAPLGERPSIVATCRFVDPVADIALLGSPDNQEMYEEAEAYEALTDAATALPIGFLPSKFAAELNGWLLSLDGAWFSCTVNYWSDGGLWTNATRAIEGGMSGSPIVADNGAAVGVLSCSNEAEKTEGGPHARVGAHLPAWVLQRVAIKATPSRLTAQGKEALRSLGSR